MSTAEALTNVREDLTRKFDRAEKKVEGRLLDGGEFHLSDGRGVWISCFDAPKLEEVQ